MAELTPSINLDVSPNLGGMTRIVRVQCANNDDTVDMATYGYTTVYAAIALVANATEAVTVTSDTLLTFTAGGTDLVTVIVYGV